MIDKIPHFNKSGTGAPEKKKVSEGSDIYREPVDSVDITGTDRKDIDRLARNPSAEFYKYYLEKKRMAPEKISEEQSEKITLNTAKLKSPAHDLSSSDKKSSREGYDVFPFESKLKKELGDWAKIQNDWDIEGLPGEIPTVSKLREMFAEVAADKSVPWDYLVDGCYSRAHVTCEKLMKKGYNCGKMYVMVGDPDINDPSYPFPPWKFRMKNKFTEGVWWYHVAPVVFAKDDKTGEINGYIIDLAANKEKTLKAEDWIRGFWTGDFPIKFDLTHADIYDPPMDMSVMPLPHEYSQEKFDRHLKEARETNKEHMRVLDAIKEEYHENHPEEAL